MYNPNDKRQNKQQGEQGKERREDAWRNKQAQPKGDGYGKQASRPEEREERKRWDGRDEEEKE